MSPAAAGRPAARVTVRRLSVGQRTRNGQIALRTLDFVRKMMTAAMRTSVWEDCAVGNSQTAN